MTTIKISEKGQVTLPIEMRRKHGLLAGAVLEVEDRAEGLLLRRVRKLSELGGMFQKYARPGMTWEKERETMERAVAEEVMGE